MTTEIVETETQKTDKPKPELVMGDRIAALVPRNIEEAYRLSSAVWEARMAPNSYTSIEQVLIGILKGMEVGLPPMSALQSIYIVNGTPTIWGDGALALVRASGLCEYVREWIDGDGDDAVAHCASKRKGEPNEEVRTFSVQDAFNAGLLNKRGPWQDYRNRMLQMRARAFLLRDVYADVLRGLRIVEEAVDVPSSDVTLSSDMGLIPQAHHVSNPLEDEPEEPARIKSHAAADGFNTEQTKPGIPAFLDRRNPAAE